MITRTAKPMTPRPDLSCFFTKILYRHDTICVAMPTDVSRRLERIFTGRLQIYWTQVNRGAAIFTYEDRVEPVHPVFVSPVIRCGDNDSSAETTCSRKHRAENLPSLLTLTRSGMGTFTCAGNGFISQQSGRQSEAHHSEDTEQARCRQSLVGVRRILAPLECRPAWRPPEFSVMATTWFALPVTSQRRPRLAAHTPVICADTPVCPRSGMVIRWARACPGTTQRSRRTRPAHAGLAACPGDHRPGTAKAATSITDPMLHRAGWS
jgi:hypothetical protein